MALIAPLFAFVGRFLGKFLNMAFGWASTLLFGRVPQSRQLLLSIVSLGSIVWVATLIGVIFPDFGEVLIGFIPLPDFIDDNWVRLAMLIAAVVLPILIGIGGLFLVDPADRPTGFGRVVQVLRGYPYAAVLALTLVLMLVVAPVRKLRSIFKRWEDAHIPMVVKPGGYERVADDIEHALDGAGFGIERAGAPRILEAPSKILAAVGGSAVRKLVPDRLLVLRNERLDVMIHPSDIAISGKKAELARARAAIASRLTFTAAFLTTNKESQDMEERLEQISNAIKTADRDGGAEFEAARAQLAEVDEELARLDVEYDEWEVLYRQRLQVERDLLGAQIGGEDQPGSSPLHKVAGIVKQLVR